MKVNRQELIFNVFKVLDKKDVEQLDIKETQELEVELDDDASKEKDEMDAQQAEQCYVVVHKNL